MFNLYVIPEYVAKYGSSFTLRTFKTWAISRLSEFILTQAVNSDDDWVKLVYSELFKFVGHNDAVLILDVLISVVEGRQYTWHNVTEIDGFESGTPMLHEKVSRALQLDQTTVMSLLSNLSQAFAVKSADEWFDMQARMMEKSKQIREASDPLRNGVI